jgi:oligopeptide transport system substrate-binding protein
MRIYYTYILLCVSILLFSCGNHSETADRTLAEGGKIYGGEMRFMSPEKIESLFPLSVTDVFSNRMISQIFEPLLTLNVNTMNVEKCLAENFTVSQDARIFTFKIRKGVFFHDDACFGGKGRELTAEDVKFTLDMACSGLDININSYHLVAKIKGALAYNSNSTKSLPKEGVAGIVVLNPSTVEITLNEPFVGFDKVIAQNALGIFPKEAYEKYGNDIKRHPVGTGAFMLDTFEKDKIVLKKNKNYWGIDDFGNQLPFLDKVVMTYAKNKKSELLAFQKKEIDLVLEIPIENIQNVFGSLEDAQNNKNVKHKIETESSLKMTYVAFACDSKEFKDERVRKAFNLAIDRQYLIENALEGEGYAAINGFVPPFENYPNNKVKGHEFSPEKARKLLAEAGYANGTKFPVLDFYLSTKEGSTIHKAMQSVIAQLKSNLNIDLKIKLCTIQERTIAINSGKAKIWRGGWIADYADPENFLCLFYSGNIHEKSLSGVNDFHFRNKEFDESYEKSLKELNYEKRNDLMTKCDQLLVDHGAVMPILTDDFIIMVNVRIKDFKTNAVEDLDFSKIYIKEQK